MKKLLLILTLIIYTNSYSYWETVDPNLVDNSIQSPMEGSIAPPNNNVIGERVILDDLNIKWDFTPEGAATTNNTAAVLANILF